MEITQDTIDAAAAEENDILQRSMLQAQIQIMNDRVIVLKAYAKSLEELLDENGIDYTIVQKDQGDAESGKKAGGGKGGNLRSVPDGASPRKPSTRKPAKKAAASGKAKKKP